MDKTKLVGFKRFTPVGQRFLRDKMAMIVKIVDVLNVSKNAKVRLTVLNKLVNLNCSQVISDRLVIIILLHFYGILAKIHYETTWPW